MNRNLEKTMLISLIFLLFNISFLYPAQLSERDIYRVAGTFLASKISIHDKFKISSTQQPQLKDIHVIPNSLKESDEPLGYIVSLKPHGFIVISNHKQIEPVIAYSFSCNYPFYNFDSQIITRTILSDLNLRMQALEDTRTSVKERNTVKWKFFLNGQFEKFIYENLQQWPKPGTTSTGGWIETVWHQRSPYNDYCPIDPDENQRCVVGCVATAFAQLLNFHQFIGSVSFDANDQYVTSNGIQIDSDSSVYDFPSFGRLNSYLDNIKTKYFQGISLLNNEISALNFAAGISVHMDYGFFGSSAFSMNIHNALINKYNYYNAEFCAPGADFFEVIKFNMMNALPAYIEIAELQNGFPEILHAIICDGYNSSDEFHLNFGWGPVLPDSIISAWYSLPDSLPAGYNFVINSIVNIKPDMPALELNKSFQKAYTVINKTIQPDTLILKNNGAGPLVIDSVIVSNPFKLSHTYGNWSSELYHIEIGPGSEDTLLVSVLAADSGLYSEKIRISYMDVEMLLPVRGFVFDKGTLIVEKNQGGTWDILNSPYYIIRDIFLENTNLNIKSGTKIRFLNHSQITVYKNAQFSAIGDSNNVISIAPHYSESTIYGITFTYSGSDDTLMYCDFYRGTINCLNQSSVYIDNNVIRHGSIGINIIRSSPYIINNIISNNIAPSRSGGISIYDFSHPVIYNNIIANNLQKCGGTSHSNSAMWISGWSNPFVVNNTFVNNLGVAEGAVVIDETGKPDPLLVNNIIWGNSPGRQLINLPSCLVMYCDIQDGIGINHNINVDPLFSDPSGGCGPDYNGFAADWRLQDSSLCKFSGIHGTEMGAYGSIPALLYCRTDTIDFGYYPCLPGQTVSQELEIINLSTTDTLKIHSMIVTNPNIAFTDSLPVFIGPGKRDTCRLKFKLDQTGSWTDTITIYSNSVSGNHSLVCKGFVDSAAGVVFYGDSLSGVLIKDNSPYYFIGENYVDNGNELNIEPGCELHFFKDSKLQISGSLCAVGTDEDKIVFTAFDSSQGWSGLLYNTTQNENILKHVILKHGKGAYFDQTGLNGGVIASIYSDLIIKNSIIRSNYAERFGGGIYFQSGMLKIENCIISGNTGSWGGGIHFQGGKAFIKSNLFHKNQAYSGRGGAVNIAGGKWSQAYIYNNTIIKNHASHHAGGILINGRTKVKLTNNILYYNSADFGPQITNYSDSVHIQYCNLEGGEQAIYGGIGGGTYNNCIETDPAFADTALYDFRLSDMSPCINAGIPDTTGLHLPDTDLDLNQRIWNNRIDMGSYEYGSEPPTYLEENSSFIPDVTSLYQNYPNPFNPVTNIQFQIAKSEIVTLKIYNLLGQEVTTLVSENLKPGNYKYTWDASGFASGVYYYRVEAGEYIETRKMILLQ